MCLLCLYIPTACSIPSRNFVRPFWDRLCREQTSFVKGEAPQKKQIAGWTGASCDGGAVKPWHQPCPTAFSTFLKTWERFLTLTLRLASFFFLRLLCNVQMNSWVSRRGRTRRVGAAQQDVSGGEWDGSVSHWHSPLIPFSRRASTSAFPCLQFYFLRLKDEEKSRADIRISVRDYPAFKMHACVS